MRVYKLGMIFAYNFTIPYIVYSCVFTVCGHPVYPFTILFQTMLAMSNIIYAIIMPCFFSCHVFFHANINIFQHKCIDVLIYMPYSATDRIHRLLMRVYVVLSHNANTHPLFVYGMESYTSFTHACLRDWHGNCNAYICQRIVP